MRKIFLLLFLVIGNHSFVCSVETQEGQGKKEKNVRFHALYRAGHITTSVAPENKSKFKQAWERAGKKPSQLLLFKTGVVDTVLHGLSQDRFDMWSEGDDGMTILGYALEIGHEIIIKKYLDIIATEDDIIIPDKFKRLIDALNGSDTALEYAGKILPPAQEYDEDAFGTPMSPSDSFGDFPDPCSSVDIARAVGFLR